MAKFGQRRWLVAGCVLAAALGGGSAAPGQAGTDQRVTSGSSLPENAPTGMGVPAGRVARRSSNKAEVEYTGGMLHVTASNSSLNQILKEVGRLTGMKITGGVQEDRVFGTYGPAPASEVLTKLLDGTASNILIVQNDQNGPAELILTPRRGGATPPNPNAAPLDDENAAQSQNLPQQQSMPVQGIYQNGGIGAGGPPGAAGLPPSNGGQTGTPIDGGANLGVTPGAFAGYGQTPPNATAQTPGQGNPGDAAPSNGVSTPQQIYEQLQRLRQQQQQQPQ